jgi:hypothetical protein
METATPRYLLPNLFVAQAQKEITHNEALTRIDALLHPVVEGSATNPPALTAADAGKCWLVGAGASGAWAGKSDHIACWIGAGWRYISPREGLSIFYLPHQAYARFTASQWRFAAQIGDPAGGAVVDSEARFAIAALLAELRATGALRT